MVSYYSLCLTVGGRKPLKRGVKGNFMADKFKTNKMLDVGSVKLISGEDSVGE